jgi:hypothetical protein
MDPRIFFPQAALDRWVADDRVDLEADILVLRDGGGRYRIAEAVRVLRELTGADDPLDIVGRVRPKSELVNKGAEIMEGSMIVGDNAYDVVQGFLARSEDGSPLDVPTLQAFVATSL